MVYRKRQVYVYGKGEQRSTWQKFNMGYFVINLRWKQIQGKPTTMDFFREYLHGLFQTHDQNGPMKVPNCWVCSCSFSFHYQVDYQRTLRWYLADLRLLLYLYNTRFHDILRYIPHKTFIGSVVVVCWHKTISQGVKNVSNRFLSG